MNPVLNQVWGEVRGCWRFRWFAFGVAALIAAGGWLLVFALPDHYEAEASVFVDTSTPLRPALQGLTVEEDVDAQINFVRQSLLAGPQLQRLAREGGLLPPVGGDPRAQEQLLADLSKRIDITVRSASDRDEDRTRAGTIYRMVYQDPNRQRALRVVGILLDTFVNQTLGGKREGAESAQQFLEAQISDDEKRLRAAEDRLAAFKSRHLGLMPTEQGGFFAQLQKEQETVADLKTKLAEADSRRATLMRQLHGDVAVAATPPAGGAAASAHDGLDTLSRIDEAQAHLDELLLRFTDKHPDVIAARQALQDLQQRRAQEIEQLKQGNAQAAAQTRVSANPVYQSVQLALNQVDVDIADLNTELAEHESKVTELRRVLDTAPQVEAEYAQLNRDYDVNKAQYTALLANLQKARLGERADVAGSVRFEVVQPPSASLAPVWPPRPRLLAQTLLLALVAGAGLAYGLHYLRPVVTSASALTETFGLTVLGAVSEAFPERARRTARRNVLQMSLASACLALAFAAVLIAALQGYHLSLTVLRGMLHKL